MHFRAPQFTKHAAPRQSQAEIEHFVNPEDKSHPKFKTVADLQPLLYSRELQVCFGGISRVRVACK